MFCLLPHPDHAPRHVTEVCVNVARNPAGGLWLEYGVREAAALKLPEACPPERTDGLWRTTCFELFYKLDGHDAYYEFNFSPSFQWAAYRFSSYRRGMTSLNAKDPEIQIPVGSDPWFFLAAEPSPNELTAGAGSFALSAVIEEQGGVTSYWSLAHPPGPPDFHAAACFAARLPAPDRA